MNKKKKCSNKCKSREVEKSRRKTYKQIITNNRNTIKNNNHMESNNSNTEYLDNYGLPTNLYSNYNLYILLSYPR